MIVRYMYSYYENNILQEGIMTKEMSKEEIAALFFDLHLAFIQVNGILYGLNAFGWSNNYTGEMEEYLYDQENSQLN